MTISLFLYSKARTSFGPIVARYMLFNVCTKIASFLKRYLGGTVVILRGAGRRPSNFFEGRNEKRTKTDGIRTKTDGLLHTVFKCT